MVPYTLPASVRQSLVVTADGRQSYAQDVDIVAAKPVIFAVNQAGTGPGIITNAASGALAQPGKAVTAGDAITVYGAGLGAINPTLVAGRAAPLTSLGYTVVKASVTIAGIPAPTLFSGLAPGYARLYQVNAVVPPGVKPGDAVEVRIAVGEQQRPPVTIAVR